MTAAAIPNIFPGSPPVAGDKVTLSAVPAKGPGFDHYLNGAEMAPAQQMNAPDAVTEETNPFKDLFDLLNLLWGKTIDETDGKNLADTNVIGSNTSVSKNQGTEAGLNGFVSELQLILSMFQKIAASLDLGESPAAVETTPVLPNETAGVQSTKSAKPAVAENTAQASAPVVAPGIDAPFANKVAKQTPSVTDTKGLNNMPSPSFPGDTSRLSEITKEGTRQVTSTDFEMPAASKSASLRAAEEGQAGVTKNSHTQLDLHLLSFSYSRSKGMDVTDITYSGNLRDGFDLGEGLSVANAQLVNISRDENGETVKMAKASLMGTDGTDLSIKKFHVSSAYLKNDKDFILTATDNGNANSPKNDPSDVLTVDFSNSQDTDSKGHNSGLLAGGGNEHHSKVQDGTVIGNNSNINQAGGESSYRSRFEGLVTTQISKGISQALKMNKNRAVLHLNPPELGSVKVNITVLHNNHVQASFVADNPETRHILETNMQHLKDSLAQNGFSTAQVNVDVGGGFANGYGTQHEKITPFGLPSMWLKNGSQETIEEPQIGQSYKTGPYGMHVIA